jgi:sec-independent protein translocase protein TatA
LFIFAGLNNKDMFSSTLLFFDFGAGELMLILFVALMLFGGKKLPELARGLGKGIRDFKDASEGVKREINNQIDSFEAKKAETAANTTAANTAAAAAESLVVAGPAPIIEPPANSVPVAEIHSEAEVAPVAESDNTPAEPVHLKETPIEPAQVTHEEFKS